ncbi:hypothetical protein HS088_TW14G00261 [Tripterygium wilfordii]|uniref:Uncharacterized protein n=1 Tax=Tripterygium wilfordii TaxID=458696 RepID=A0A7J7CQH6_TRIWF|nr:hypothetical protein HS088_TW14G00261 [Tripterygium wilfordii]
MANVTYTACLFLVLIMIFSSTELGFIEGRKLTKNLVKDVECFSPDGKSVPRNTRKNINVASPKHYLHHGIKDSEGFVEAFRPTTPGHSPGVGHSIHN